MNTQDVINKHLREQLGGLMIDLIIAKTELEARELVITELKSEIDQLREQDDLKGK